MIEWPDAVNRIFDVTYPVILEPEDAFLIRRDVKEVKVNDATRVEAGVGFCISTGASSDEEVVTGFLKYDDLQSEDAAEIIGKDKVNTQIAISDMAEMLGKGGCFSLKKPEDSVRIYDDLCSYNTALNFAEMGSLNFIPPPAEDIALLENLRKELQDLRMAHEEVGAGNHALSDLFDAVDNRSSATGIKSHTKSGAPVIIGGKRGKTTQQARGDDERDNDVLGGIYG